MHQFRIWRIDAKPFLKSGANSLRVVFSAQDKAAEAIARRDPGYPRNTVPARSYLRKPAYEHGWDWGPVFVTGGIWRPVRLEAWTIYLGFDGKVISISTTQVTVPPLSSTVLTSIPLTQLSEQSGGRLVSRNLTYLAPTRQIKLPTARVHAEVTKQGNEFVVKLSTDTLARSVRLLTADDAVFEDNYFDLLPGETRSIRVKTSISADKFQKGLQVTLQQDAFNPRAAS